MIKGYFFLISALIYVLPNCMVQAASIGGSTVLETRVHDLIAGTTEFIPVQVGLVSSQSQGQVSTQISDNLPHIMSSASAYADQIGTLRARSVSQSSNPGFIQYITLRDEARATFSETFTISPMGVPVGTVASTTQFYEFHGSFLGDDLGVSNISFFSAGGSILLNTTVTSSIDNNIVQTKYDASFNHARRLQNLGLRVARNEPLGVIGPSALSLTSMGYGFSETLENEFFFQIGVPFTVSVILETKAFSNAKENGDFASIDIDGGNTASWGGFGDIILNDGTTISDYTAIGDGSGIDYRYAIAPVPLPAGVGLIVLPLTVLLGRRSLRLPVLRA